MLEPKAGTGTSEGCEAASQLSVRLLPYAPGPGWSPAEAVAIPTRAAFAPAYCATCLS